MSYQDYIWEMLRPLRVYQQDGLFQQGELKAIGETLDGVFSELEDLQKEMNLMTAEGWGLQQIASLFELRPSSLSEAEQAEALRALLRISGDGFTVEALNQTLAGCGTLAHVAETDQVGVVQVSFPNVPGKPSGFENICYILENILPAHLSVLYDFWYIDWAHFQASFPTFWDLDGANLTWRDLEASVE